MELLLDIVAEQLPSRSEVSSTHNQTLSDGSTVTRRLLLSTSVVPTTSQSQGGASDMDKQYSDFQAELDAIPNSISNSATMMDFRRAGGNGRL